MINSSAKLWKTKGVSFLSELKTVGLFAITALAEIVGCYLPYLWLREGKSIWLLVPSALSLVADFTPNRRWQSLCCLRWCVCNDGNPMVMGCWWYSTNDMGHIRYISSTSRHGYYYVCTAQHIDYQSKFTDTEWSTTLLKNNIHYIGYTYSSTGIQKGLGYKSPRQVWFDFYRQAA